MIYTVSPNPRSEFETSPKWVRVYLNNQLIADSKKMMLLREPDHLPLYFFPEKDVKADFLRSSDHTSQSELKGEGKYWHVQVGDKIADNAAFTFSNPPGSGPNLEGFIAFAWKQMDAWFEEDEEVFYYARDPYKRVDILYSSRQVKVEVEGLAVAETRRPWLLFETGLPTRYYFPPTDLRMELLERSDVVTRCPYKGEAQLFGVRVGNQLHEGFAWNYRYPTRECAQIQGLFGFLNEKVDIYEDGELLARPKTPWSTDSTGILPAGQGRP